MITLTIIILLWGIISTYRIYKQQSPKNYKKFEPLDAKYFIDCFGFYVSMLWLASIILYCIINYLP